jgi:hypothetical protein
MLEGSAGRLVEESSKVKSFNHAIGTDLDPYWLLPVGTDFGTHSAYRWSCGVGTSAQIPTGHLQDKLGRGVPFFLAEKKPSTVLMK